LSLVETESIDTAELSVEKINVPFCQGTRRSHILIHTYSILYVALITNTDLAFTVLAATNGPAL
jgi:hypothetical protein